jgi:hypothetical protein
LEFFKIPPYKKLAKTSLFALGVSLSASNAATVFTENFTYADVSLVGAPGSPWATHSGTTPGQVNVVSGAVVITGSESEDVNANIAGGTGFYYNTGTLTTTFDVTFTALPSGAGTYFLHYKDATASGFRGRVFATTTGAASGSFRFAIADTTTTFAPVTTDLGLNTTYIVTLTLNAATGRSSLAINGGAAVTATDTTSQLNISTVALRQSSNEGTMTIDNIVVDASAAAVPEASTASLGIFLVGLGLLRRRR